MYVVYVVVCISYSIGPVIGTYAWDSWCMMEQEGALGIGVHVLQYNFYLYCIAPCSLPSTSSRVIIMIMILLLS